ncbi:hypothetical protein BC834DRAFT_895442 [Gloeopeniophorella convolvens]|nr:hypothetical protein BC834DRAFT_895442 [Gloeopeniophorella convolvens]
MRSAVTGIECLFLATFRVASPCRVCHYPLISTSLHLLTGPRLIPTKPGSKVRTPLPYKASEAVVESGHFDPLAARGQGKSPDMASCDPNRPCQNPDIGG